VLQAGKALCKYQIGCNRVLRAARTLPLGPEKPKVSSVEGTNIRGVAGWKDYLYTHAPCLYGLRVIVIALHGDAKSCEMQQNESNQTSSRIHRAVHFTIINTVFMTSILP